MKKSIFQINKMDCPIEEQIIRMKLKDISAIKQLQFDITARKLSIIHNIDEKLIENALLSKKLNQLLKKIK